jgi:hypothetical protein
MRFGSPELLGRWSVGSEIAQNQQNNLREEGEVREAVLMRLLSRYLKGEVSMEIVRKRLDLWGEEDIALCQGEKTIE